MTLFFHYLKLAFRNIIKYKAQSIICILSIAVSATLLTVVWSLLREITPPEIYSQPYAEKVCTVAIDQPEPEGGYWRYDFDAMKAVEKMQLRAAERICFDHYSRTTYKLTVERDGGRKWQTTSFAFGVRSDYLRWFGYRSKVSGKPVPELADDEVIITKRMAQKLFGKTDVIGRTILMEDAVSRDHEAREFRIADVIHPSQFNRNTADIDLFYRNEEYSDYLVSDLYVQLRDGFTADDLRAEVEKMFPTDKIRVGKEYEDFQNEERVVFIGKNTLLALLIAFLAISVVGFLRMKAQLFRIRQREIALRTVLGSKRRQLVALFSTEIALVLILAFALTLGFNSLLRNLMGTKLRLLLAQLYWPMDNFTEISAFAYLLIAVVSIAVVWLVVRNIRRQQTGLAMQMRPSRGSAMSVATITFQILMSTIFVAITIGASCIILGTINKQGKPANDSFYQNCYMVSFPSGEYADKGRELLDLLTHSENIDHLVTYNNAGDMIKTDTAEVSDSPARYVQFYFQREREMFDFFCVQPVITNPAANPQQSVFISEEMMREMQRGGTWERGYIDIMTKRYDIAGYYGNLPYMGKFYSLKYNAVVTDPDHFVADPLQYQHIVVPKKGRERQARREIETRFDEMYNEVMEGYTGFRLTSYREMQAPQLDVLEVLLSVFLIVAAISLISTVASLYSVISLDTRRRRKEVALRKIHGARTSVIARLFARRYIIICAVSYAILLPLVLGFFIILGADGTDFAQEYGLTPCTLYLPTVLLISLVVFLTVVWKIREVMHIKPAEWLKE